MSARVAIVVSLLLMASCTGVRSVQLTPPIPTPPGLIWGYGVEKVRREPDAGRHQAYLKAIDDLLTRGPILVSKAVQDNTTVVDAKSARRTMVSNFRLRASRILQPSFIESGLEDGYVWVLIGTTEDDVERGWRQFVEWRGQKIEQARTLFESAKNAPDRLPVLKASFALLEEVEAQDDPTLLYYEVKTALDAEVTRIAELERLQNRFRAATESGQLVTAETALDQALRLGLDPALYNQYKMEIHNRRVQAQHLISAGDDLYRDEKYREALDRYEQAQRLDRDNAQLPGKLAMADRNHRNARGQTVRSTVGMVGWGATRILGEYINYKREQEARKRAEAEQAAEEARREDAARRRRDNRRNREHEPAVPPEQQTVPPEQPTVAPEQQPEQEEEKKEEGKKEAEAPPEGKPVKKKVQ